MAHACVDVEAYGVDHALALPTDKHGVAQLRLTNKGVEVNLRNRWKACGDLGVMNPVVRYSNFIYILPGYVWCVPHAPDHSWLRVVKFSTKRVFQSGIVTANTCGSARAKPKPGEIIIFVRPLTLWEKLKE